MVHHFEGVALLNQTADIGQVRRQPPSFNNSFLGDVNHHEYVVVLGNGIELAVFVHDNREIELTERELGLGVGSVFARRRDSQFDRHCAEH